MTPLPESRRAPPWRPGQSGNPAGGKPKALPKHALTTITELASRGVRFDTIARSVGVCDVTLRRRMKDDARIAEAYERGRALLHDELVGVLVEKAKSGDVVPLLFALKVLFGYRDQGPVDAEPRPAVIINLPAALSMANYAPKLVEHEGERIE